MRLQARVKPTLAAINLNLNKLYKASVYSLSECISYRGSTFKLMQRRKKK